MKGKIRNLSLGHNIWNILQILRILIKNQIISKRRTILNQNK